MTPAAVPLLDELGRPLPCIFCGEEAGSNEHVWPDWLLRFIEGHAKAGTPKDALRAFREEAEIVAETVCSGCNLGWMHKLEDLVSPVLKSMFDGEPVQLTRGQAFALRRWIAKTAVMFESFCGYQIASEHLRRGLRDGGSTGDSQVLVGRYSGRHRFLSHVTTFYRREDRAQPTLSWTVLVMGHVIVCVLADYDKAVTPSEFAAERFVELLPGPGTIVEWPPELGVDDDVVDQLDKGPVPSLRQETPDDQDDDHPYRYRGPVRDPRV